MNPSKIAKRLTKSQKRNLLWLSEREKRVEHNDGTHWTSLGILWKNNLAEIGPSGHGWWHATPLGLLVRAELEKERAAGGGGIGGEG